MQKVLQSVIVAFFLLVVTASLPAQSAEFKVEELNNGTALIFVRGEIETGDETRFRRLSVSFPTAIVALDSNGGKLIPAIEIGKIVRLAGYATIVADDFVCSSSCALIWLAGSPRYLETAGKVGFHASYRDNDGRFEETGVGNAIIGHYLSLLNLPQSAVIFATSASPNDITWLDSSNMERSGIDYRSMDTGTKIKLREGLPVPIITTVGSPNVTTQTVSIPPPVVRTVATPPKQLRTIADYSLIELKAMLTKQYRDRAFIRTIFSRMNLSDHGLASVVEHAMILYADDRYLDRLASELYEARGGFSGDAGDGAIGMSIGQALNVKLTLNGLSRLSDKDIKNYLSYTIKVFASASDAECKAIATGKDEFGRIELKLLQGLGSDDFAGYLALSRRAITAELQDFPLKIIPSKVESEAGQKSLENYLVSEIEKLPKSEQERLSSAIAALEEANEKDNCDGNYIILKSLYDLGGMPGNWKRREFVNSLAN